MHRELPSFSESFGHITRKVMLALSNLKIDIYIYTPKQHLFHLRQHSHKAPGLSINMCIQPLHFCHVVAPSQLCCWKLWLFQSNSSLCNTGVSISCWILTGAGQAERPADFFWWFAHEHYRSNWGQTRVQGKLALAQLYCSEISYDLRFLCKHG